MSLVVEGCIDALFASPPCATWSRLRFRPGGPAPLRRRGLESWGLAGLRGRFLQELRNANILMLNTLSLLEAVSNRGGLVGMEHPDDPVAGHTRRCGPLRRCSTCWNVVACTPDLFTSACVEDLARSQRGSWETHLDFRAQALFATVDTNTRSPSAERRQEVSFPRDCLSTHPACAR